jgi:hypothetical protein
VGAGILDRVHHCRLTIEGEPLSSSAERGLLSTMRAPRAILTIVSGFVLLAVLSRVGLAFSPGPVASEQAEATAGSSGLSVFDQSGRQSFGPRVDGTAFAAGIPTFVVIEATPPEAQVFLDGHLLGVARDLVVRAFRLTRGQHTVAVTALGFRPYSARFDVQPSFPTQLRIALVPE